MKNNWMSRNLTESDPEIAQAIANEANRQHEGQDKHCLQSPNHNCTSQE